MYCVLRALVNVRNRILGDSGWTKDAQIEFLILLENAIRQPDLAKSVRRYQLSLDEAKARLHVVVIPRGWLMPARMVINTERVVC